MRRNRFKSVRRFERLEDRRMMVGGINYDGNSDTLTIDGDNYDDVAEVRFSGNRVYVDLVAEESDGDTDHHADDWRISDVDAIVFNGFAGDDTLTINVEPLNTGVTLDNVKLYFFGYLEDDQLFQNSGGIQTVAEGGPGNDRLEGSWFEDTLNGGSGDDTYVFAGSSLGRDSIMAEPSNADRDTLDFSNFAQAVDVDLSARFDILDSPAEHTVDSVGLRLDIGIGNAIENVIGTQFNDRLTGNSRDNRLEGRGGNDTYIFSGASLGTDEIHEAANVGKDTLDFSEFEYGVYVNLATVYNPNANDPHSTHAVTTWGHGQVRLFNASSIEDVIGTVHDDVIKGNWRNNHLIGLDGGDNFTGEGGDDTLEGGAGDDIYHFAGEKLGTDTINEAANRDNDGLRFSGMTHRLTIDLTKRGTEYAVESANLKLKLANDTAIERVWGTDYNDVIIGNSRNNRLYGRGSNDSIIGGDGADYLHGGDDQDYLFSDALDEVYGGAGWDYFEWYGEQSWSNPDPTRYRDWGVN